MKILSNSSCLIVFKINFESSVEMKNEPPFPWEFRIVVLFKGFKLSMISSSEMPSNERIFLKTLGAYSMTSI